MRGSLRARLLERGRELSELEAAVAAAVAGEGGIVVVEGPAGIGKSELLRAAAEIAHAQEARPLTARGLELEYELAFGAARQLLGPVVQGATAEDRARLFAGAAAPTRELFDCTPPERGLAADPEFAILNGLYWLLAGLADAEPLALIVDDAHWLDPPSLRLLDFLAPRIEELSAVAIIGTRPAQDELADAVLGRLLADPATRQVRPGPLSSTAVRRFVRERLRKQPDQAFVEKCAEITGGNPFYLGELLRELEHRGVRGTSDEAAQVSDVGPRSISLSLHHRGAATGMRTALARALSVLGESDNFGLLAELASLDRADAASAADSLVRDGILTRVAPLAFAHPIVRNAVYSGMAPRERADFHAHAARLLRASHAPGERVAAHLMRTDAASDPRVVAELRAAARDALRQGAPLTAAAYLKRALAEPPEESARLELLLELARVETTALDQQSAEHFAEAYALAPDVRTRAEVTLAAAPALFIMSRQDDALAMAGAIQEQLRREDPDLALELEVEFASLALYQLGVSSETPHFDHSGERIQADSPVSRRVLCHAAVRRTWRSEGADIAAELVQRGLADGLLLSERGTETPDITSAGLTLIYADRLESARDLVDAALAHARTRGAPFGFALVAALAAELSCRRGALADAEADARMSLAITVPARQPAGMAVGAAILIGALTDRGALSEALEVLNEQAPADAPPSQFNWLLSARGRLHLACGDRTRGIADLRSCGDRNRELGIRNPLICPWRSDLALAYHARGDHGSAQALADEELAAAQDWGTPGTIGSAKRLMGVLTSGEARITNLREAVALLDQSPARLEQARALVDLGAALRRANRRAEAREPLSRGLHLADSCGATILARRAHDELAATGARPRRARLKGLEALTASERRVAEMAARGLSNTEIAQTLFVTRKTVEKHLGNTYTKLGAKSRAELPARLTEEGQPTHSENPFRHKVAARR